MFWVVFWLWLAFTVIGELLRPKPKFDTPQPSALGDFQVPTAEEGRCIPIVWGTCLVKGPNVVWYGDLKAVAVKKKVKTGWFSSTKITLGYKYFMGQQLALCYGPIDEIMQIRFGDQKIAAYVTTPFADGVAIDVFEDNLFGGITKDGVQGGGVSGRIQFYFGTNTQIEDSYLRQILGRYMPGYRGLCYAVFRGMYLGTSSYLKHPAFLMRRCPNQLGMTGGKHNIDGDANPACMIYEILTDTRWGLGIPTAMIDSASLIAVGETMFSETFGLSMQVDTPMSANDLLQEILRHIDGVLYTDPQTGLITVKLARKDYVEADLMTLDESAIEEIDFTRGSWADTKNTVKITYIDRDQEWQQRVAQDQELANIQGRNGEIVLEQISFRGVSNKNAAALIAARVRKTVAYPLARSRIKVNRKAWKLRPASVFKLNWPALGVNGMVMRVTRIRYGTLKDGWIEMDCVEDIFSVASAAYTPPPDSEWTNPYTAPQPVTYSQLIESPAQLAGGQLRAVMTLAVRANGTDHGYDVWADTAGGTNYVLTNSNSDFNATGTLIGSLPKTGAAQMTSLAVTGGRDMDSLENASDDEFMGGTSLMLIDNEIIAWKTITNNGDGTYTLGTVWRGVLDTVPEDHAAGARVWFLDGSGITHEDPLSIDVNMKAKLLPFNLLGKLPIASATQISIITDSRAWKPLPAGNVKINALAWPTYTYGDAAVTWARRHRLEQIAALRIIAQDAVDFSANIEGNYTVNVYVGGTLKRTITGITSPSYTYTGTMRQADDSDGTKVTRIRILPVNGSYTGTAQDRDFTMTGFGMTFGLYFGGQQA